MITEELKPIVTARIKNMLKETAKEYDWCAEQRKNARLRYLTRYAVEYGIPLNELSELSKQIKKESKL